MPHTSLDFLPVVNPGNSLRSTHVFKDPDGAVQTPTTPKFRVVDPDGTNAVADTDPDPGANATEKVAWFTPNLAAKEGKYKFVWTGTLVGKPYLVDEPFLVRKESTLVL